MKIIKYLFLLVLLSIVAASIFVATQKGDFSVERSKVINSPKNSVYNYVNDYKNWEDFGSWSMADSEIKYFYPQKTIGKDAFYTWEGRDGNGNVKTIFVKENDSIVQKMNYDGTESDIFWSFKDTVGGTKVTWKTKGKMSFLFKIYTAFNGGVEKVIGGIYEKSLNNLDKTLVYEINTYAVKVDGVVKRPETFYIYQQFTSEISKVIKNVRIVTPKMLTFCQKNNIEVAGKPFVIYHTYNLVTGLANISICIPIKSPIYTSAGSELLTAKLEAYEAVKTTLIGDYSHQKNAMIKAQNYINTNRIATDPSLSHIEVYSIGKNEIKSPSKWVTEIYFPTKPLLAPKLTNVSPIQATVTPNATNAVPPNSTETVIPAPKQEATVPKPKTETVIPKTKTDAVTQPVKKEVVPAKPKKVATPANESELPSEF